MATILIVDGDRDVLDLYRDFLGPAYLVHTADRVERAFQLLECERYDVIITDLLMPGLSGFEVLQVAQRQDNTVPVIIVTGSVVTNEDAISKVGAFAFLRKPFQLEQVEDLVVRALAYRQQKVIEKQGSHDNPINFETRTDT